MLLLNGTLTAFLCATAGVEEVELLESWTAVAEAGGDRRLVSPVDGRIQCFDHLDRADTIRVESSLDDVGPDAFDGLVLPGGVANADSLRAQPDAVGFARAFFDAGKPVVAIGHGSRLLIDAGVLPGRTLTSASSLRTDICNAGAAWVDDAVVQCMDGPSALITSAGGEHLGLLCDVLGRALAGDHFRLTSPHRDATPTVAPPPLWP